VQDLTGGAFTVDVAPDCTSASLRAAVCKKLNVGLQDIELLAKGIPTDTADGLTAVLNGSRVYATPRARSGLNQSASTNGFQMASAADPEQLLQMIQSLASGGAAPAGARLQVMLQTADGKTVPAGDFSLDDAAGMLKDGLSGGSDGVVKLLDSFASVAAAKKGDTQDAGSADDSKESRSDAKNDQGSKGDDAVRAKQQVYDRGCEIFAERQRRHAENVRMSAKMEALREKRAAKAARRRRRAAARKRSTDTVVDTDASKAQASVGFAGLRRGFFL